jgi:3-deoxy-7-phosphoheptulonate synthase
MIFVFKPQVKMEVRNQVEDLLKTLNADYTETRLGDRQGLVINKIQFNGPKVDWLAFEAIDRVIQFKSEYPKVAISESGRSTIDVNGLKIGPGRLIIIAGPCAVENEEQLMRVATSVKMAGAHVLRGGAYKPRTSPYSFQGVGLDGLKALSKAGRATDLKVVTEALDLRDLASVVEYCDMVQIGSRNMQNFPLLKEVGKINKPVLLKRGMSATIQEWLLAAEYIAEAGNPNIILCERGIRSFDTMTRNLLDLSCVPILQQETRLPIAVDPSHGTGRRDAVEAMSLAAAAAGCQALMIEVHDEGSQLIGYAVNPNDNDIVLDACAGAGGKSLHIADLQNDSGVIISTDIQ